MINLDSILELLDMPKETLNLFSLRRSKRAKKLIFRPSIRKGIEIVLPRVYNEKWVLETVIKNKPKIINILDEIKVARTNLRPKSIVLTYTGTTWNVIYRGANDKYFDVINETNTTLELPEKSDDLFGTSLILQKWLHGKANQYLPKHLHNVSIKLKLVCNKVRITRQKTTWGRCSSEGNINLNPNLMLLPREAVDYVIHHELIHLKVLNHSPKFWKELERSLPDYKKRRVELKCFAYDQIPDWALV